MIQGSHHLEGEAALPQPAAVGVQYLHQLRVRLVHSALGPRQLEEGVGGVEAGQPGQLAQPQGLHPLGHEPDHVGAEAVAHQVDVGQHIGSVSGQQNNCKSIQYSKCCSVVIIELLIYTFT